MRTDVDVQATEHLAKKRLAHLPRLQKKIEDARATMDGARSHRTAYTSASTLEQQQVWSMDGSQPVKAKDERTSIFSGKPKHESKRLSAADLKAKLPGNVDSIAQSKGVGQTAQQHQTANDNAQVPCKQHKHRTVDCIMSCISKYMATPAAGGMESGPAGTSADTEPSSSEDDHAAALALLEAAGFESGSTAEWPQELLTTIALRFQEYSEPSGISNIPDPYTMALEVVRHQRGIGQQKQQRAENWQEQQQCLEQMQQSASHRYLELYSLGVMQQIKKRQLPPHVKATVKTTPANKPQQAVQRHQQPAAASSSQHGHTVSKQHDDNNKGVLPTQGGAAAAMPAIIGKRAVVIEQPATAVSLISQHTVHPEKQQPQQR